MRKYKLFSMMLSSAIGTYVVISLYKAGSFGLAEAIILCVGLGVAIGTLHAIFMPDIDKKD